VCVCESFHDVIQIGGQESDPVGERVDMQAPERVSEKASECKCNTLECDNRPFARAREW
jgi:hypothetical protein